MSGCYRCGSSEGSEVRPCSNCIKNRHTEEPRTVEAFKSQYTEEYNDTPRSPISSSTLLATIGVFFVLGTFAMLNWSKIMVYTGHASANDLYNVCLSAAQGQISKVSSHEKMDGLGKAIISGAMVEMCSQLKETCTKSPDGAECTKLKEIAKMMARS